MRCIDTNVLLYAHRSDLPDHAEYRALLERLANDDTEPLGVPGAVLSGFVRLITNHRIFNAPSTPQAAWTAVDELLSAPATMRLDPGQRHWPLFRRLAEEIDARGNGIPDAYLAAHAVENNATWLSADRGFARFTSLRWRHPLEL